MFEEYKNLLKERHIRDVDTALFECRLLIEKEGPASQYQSIIVDEGQDFSMAELDEMSYRDLLWMHTPLRDFWRVGKGISAKLEANGMFTMGDIALRSTYDETIFYKLFGINAELLIDHD